jgi:hypothetical protein
LAKFTGSSYQSQPEPPGLKRKIPGPGSLKAWLSEKVGGGRKEGGRVPHAARRQPHEVHIARLIVELEDVRAVIRKHPDAQQLVLQKHRPRTYVVVLENASPQFLCDLYLFTLTAP